MKSLKLFKVASCVVIGLCSVSLFAQSGSVVFTVNGSKIYSSQVNEMVSMAVSNGAKDSPELRQSILNDLIVREVIIQDIKKIGLLNKDNNVLKLKLAQQNTMLDLWFAEYFKSHPITDDDIKAEYDRQLALSKEAKKQSNMRWHKLWSLAKQRRRTSLSK